jgi:uncharacterized protein
MHPNEGLARSAMEATQRGDIEGMLAHYSDDVVFHYPGRNVLSGTHRGKDALHRWMDEFGEILGEGGSLTRTLHDVVAGDDHVVSLISVEARRTGGRTARWNAVLVMHVTDGKISEMWGNIDDPYAVDHLLA